MKERLTFFVTSIAALLSLVISLIQSPHPVTNRLWKIKATTLQQQLQQLHYWVLPIDEFTHKLESYSSNIARTRKYHITDSHHHHNSSSTIHFINAVQSLYFTLRNQQDAILNQHTLLNNTQYNISLHQRDLLANSLVNTCVQAIRGLSDIGDYTLIIKLLQTLIALAKDFSTLYNISDNISENNNINNNNNNNITRIQATPILYPRIFGEAFIGLGQKTLCSTSKLKKIWNIFVSCYSSQHNHVSSPIFINTPSAVELTAIITAFAKRGKVKAALHLFYSMIGMADIKNITLLSSTLIIRPDSYAISEILRILADSIPEPVSIVNNNNNKNNNYYYYHKSDDIMDQRDHEEEEEEEEVDESTQIQQITDSYTNCCWQWRETMDILDWAETHQHRLNLTTPILNNHAFSAALKVNERAHILFGTKRHKGAQNAIALLDRMKSVDVLPDVITVSTVIATLDKTYQWKKAVELLESMEKIAASKNWKEDPVIPGNHPWTLPFPNIYTYSSAVSSCARCGQYDQAQAILERMRQYSREGGCAIAPNTWVYNSVLSACLRDTDTQQGGIPQGIQQPAFNTALRMLQYMEEDSSKGCSTLPDTVTYNTVLTLIGGLTKQYPVMKHDSISSPQEVSTGLTRILIEAQERKEEAIMRLFDEMVERGITRNEITHRNGLMACRGELEGMIRIFRRVLLDTPEVPVRTNLANLALSFCASSDQLSFIATVFDIMRGQKIPADTESMSHLIKALYSSRRTEQSIWMLNAMKGDSVANQRFVEKTSIDILACGIALPMIEEEHYSTAIIGCLNTDEMFQAQKILSGMKIHGLTPKDNNLEQFILAYCKMSIDAASKEFSAARQENLKKEAKEILLKPSHQTSTARATAALNMMKSLRSPTLQVRLAVARALAASGMHTNARQILRSLHELVVDNMMEMTMYGKGLSKASSRLYREVPKLHKSLLKLCARSGNITAALWYADDIQQMSNEINRNSLKVKPSVMLYDPKISLSSTSSSFAVPIGMSGEDWKLVTIAASKASHWKICVKTLQFLKPHLEATNLFQSRSSDPLSSADEYIRRKKLDSQYENLSRALTAAVLAYEHSGQYAWGIRAINDWIEWTGNMRRPPKEAVFSLCRILAERGQGAHVAALIQQVLQIPSSYQKQLSKLSKKIDCNTSYESAVYSQAIVALGQNGLYDTADELYAAGVAGGFLPFPLMKKLPNEKFYQLDLHGMSSAIAHSAVRVSLQHLIQMSGSNPITQDVIIVTGRGRGSTRWLRPVLRPEVQRMLCEEFYPPISTVSIPGNMGALTISSTDVNQWMNHQQEQKGKRLLLVAEILKSFTTGSRLSKALSKLK